MKWAEAQGYRRDNPAGDAIGAVLPRHKATGKRHHRALPYGKVADAIEAVHISGASMAVKLAFEFLILTATRSGEVRSMTWNEIKLEAAVWTIPAERMKAGREHRVPLCARAVEILTEARQLGDGSGLVFRGTRPGKPLSDMTLSKLMRDLGMDAVPHGFRSSFRDWAAECTNAPRAVMEAALAHTVRDKAEAAYARSDLFERRRRLMNQWADYSGYRQRGPGCSYGPAREADKCVNGNGSPSSGGKSRQNISRYSRNVLLNFFRYRGSNEIWQLPCAILCSGKIDRPHYLTTWWRKTPNSAYPESRNSKYLLNSSAISS